MCKKTIDKMVDHFLSWKLPLDFYPDGGVSFSTPRDINNWPTGTNLLTADQARKMFEHVLGADEHCNGRKNQGHELANNT